MLYRKKIIVKENYIPGAARVHRYLPNESAGSTARSIAQFKIPQ